MASGDNLNCDNQSVRISCYSGSHTGANTCTALQVNEFTEAKRLYAIIGLTETGQRIITCIFLTSIECIHLFISKPLILTLTTMFLT